MVLRNRVVTRICNLFKLLLRVEEFIDSIPEDVEVYGFEAEHEDLRVSVTVCVSQEVDKGVEEVLGDLRLRIAVAKAMCSGRGENLYNWVARQGARFALSTLAPRVLENREYALILLSTCEAVLVPGSERKVFVPTPRNVRTLLFAHSHPRGPALFSYRDLLSAANMLSDGTVEVCVVGVDGALCLYRKYYLMVEDFEKLIELANSLEATTNLEKELINAQSLGVVRI